MTEEELAEIIAEELLGRIKSLYIPEHTYRLAYMKSKKVDNMIKIEINNKEFWFNEGVTDHVGEIFRVKFFIYEDIKYGRVLAADNQKLLLEVIEVDFLEEQKK